MLTAEPGGQIGGPEIDALKGENGNDDLVGRAVEDGVHGGKDKVTGMAASATSCFGRVNIYRPVFIAMHSWAGECIGFGGGLTISD